MMNIVVVVVQYQVGMFDCTRKTVIRNDNSEKHDIKIDDLTT